MQSSVPISGGALPKLRPAGLLFLSALEPPRLHPKKDQDIKEGASLESWLLYVLVFFLMG